MISVLFDTNILVDIMISREQFIEDSERLVAYVAGKKICGFVTANSVTDVYYLVKKNLPKNIAREELKKLLYAFEIIEVSGPDCRAAFDIKIADYEDALLVVCAQKLAIDYIVTRDSDLLKYSNFNVVSPKALLTLI